MKTLVTSSPRSIARLLAAGGVAAFPTETVYGLGANAFDAEAVRRIFRAKGRPQDNPLIVHVASIDQVGSVADRVTPAAARLLAAFAPGPITVVLPAHPLLPAVVTAGLGTVGVRIPSHPVARALLGVCGFPLAAPSANRSGRPSPTTWRAVRTDLDGRIAGILRGAAADFGLESTVVDCTGRVPVLLRAGAVTLEQLRKVAPSIRVAARNAALRARSPGQKYRHYAPAAVVTVIPAGAPPPPCDAFIGLHAPPGAPRRRRICADADAYARELFHFFRVCDAAGVRRIACEAVPETGIGLALMDRLRRAEQR
ncbi:MAG: L-threonylcarbamoyladenylate synthase [Kiritimatiellia bacterium]